MSKWLDLSDALKAHLEATVDVCGADETIAEEDRVPVVVDRQKDIDAEISKAVSSAKGACVMILWTGGKNADPEEKALNLGGNYSIKVLGLPVINAGIDDRIPIDELTEQVAAALHGYAATTRNFRNPERLRVLDVDLVPNGQLLIYEITAEVKRLF